MPLDTLIIADYLGVYVFATSGALLAASKRLDLFGFAVLALMPAVGGGTLRDLLLDQPVFWIADPTYLYITLTASLITFFSAGFLNRLREPLAWFDALGLAVFCALGAAKAMQITQDPLVSVAMGVVTAVAGGIVRDVVANDLPLILHKQVYATAAFAGASAYVLAKLFTTWPEDWLLLIAISLAFATRALGIVFGLSLPAYNDQKTRG